MVCEAGVTIGWRSRHGKPHGGVRWRTPGRHEGEGRGALVGSGSPTDRICNRLPDLNSLQLWAMRSRLAGAGVWGMQDEATSVTAGGTCPTGLPQRSHHVRTRSMPSLTVSAHQRLLLNPAHFVTVHRT